MIISGSISRLFGQGSQAFIDPELFLGKPVTDNEGTTIGKIVNVCGDVWYAEVAEQQLMDKITKGQEEKYGYIDAQVLKTAIKRGGR